MEPRIQYAKTSDGVSIAYYAIGQGPPLVWMPNMPGSHLQLEWRIPNLRRFYERVSQQWTLVRYDARGFGLSDRSVLDFPLEALARDLDAVADRLQLEPFAISAMTNASLVAITYAARHPERVSHLALWHGYPRAPERWRQALTGLLALAEKDWALAVDAYLHTAWGWGQEGELVAQFASLLHEAVSQETFLAFFRQFQGWDVSGLLPLLRTPTLVAQRREYRMISVDTGQTLAAAIPGARLAILEGSSPTFGSDLFEVLNDFLGGAQTPQPVERNIPGAPPSGMTAILFADIADSTALTERMGDAAFRDKARELDAALRAIIRENGGTPIEGKLLGDGVLALFTSAREAIEAATRCAAAVSHGGLPLHVGLHAGDVIREENNVYGGAVNIAARISGLSAPGEVLVSDTVRGLARTSAGVSFEDRGEQALKGVSEPVRVFAVREGDV